MQLGVLRPQRSFYATFLTYGSYCNQQVQKRRSTGPSSTAPSKKKTAGKYSRSLIAHYDISMFLPPARIYAGLINHAFDYERLSLFSKTGPKAMVPDPAEEAARDIDVTPEISSPDDTDEESRWEGCGQTKAWLDLFAQTFQVLALFLLV
jgi:hypothetical protein